MPSAWMGELVGKKRSPLPSIRTAGGGKEPPGWKKKGSGVGQLGGGGGTDEISSEGRPCL